MARGLEIVRAVRGTKEKIVERGVKRGGSSGGGGGGGGYIG